mmetsp:Transcript_17904/g.37165  ORF Transcript_17904/g.37165 Transcript_17904/m.37165 type:complete len:541 (-) Transcript_17904:354-1976(-)|eukprot:CAMPEP_0184688472 /NCGR_PEP_ID=MMETSP0312-20130426/29991_1 /TAXON_ID=31354 /ORGANISM="Compsopogon coeruleus, Strain SAG 36.94" /LENGTH=540 /DNA_ID=CAMNT_0027145679 /DNA_START=121 /DNA_END=1743 /DNA_ORIENTATION=+
MREGGNSSSVSGWNAGEGPAWSLCPEYRHGLIVKEAEMVCRRGLGCEFLHLGPTCLDVRPRVAMRMKRELVESEPQVRTWLKGGGEGRVCLAFASGGCCSKGWECELMHVAPIGRLNCCNEESLDSGIADMRGVRFRDVRFGLEMGDVNVEQKRDPKVELEERAFNESNVRATTWRTTNLHKEVKTDDDVRRMESEEQPRTLDGPVPNLSGIRSSMGENQEDMQLKARLATNHMVHEPIPHSAERWVCKICSIFVVGLAPAKSHIEGKKHLTQMKCHRLVVDEANRSLSKERRSDSRKEEKTDVNLANRIQTREPRNFSSPTEPRCSSGFVNYTDKRDSYRAMGHGRDTGNPNSAFSLDWEGIESRSEPRYPFVSINDSFDTELYYATDRGRDRGLSNHNFSLDMRGEGSRSLFHVSTKRPRGEMGDEYDFDPKPGHFGTKRYQNYAELDTPQVQDAVARCGPQCSPCAKQEKRLQHTFVINEKVEESRMPEVYFSNRRSISAWERTVELRNRGVKAEPVLAGRSPRAKEEPAFESFEAQ